MTASPRALAARAHPFTPLALAACVAVLAVALPGPGPVLWLYGATVLLAIATGVGSAALRALVPLAPLWCFLFLLHGVVSRTADPGSWFSGEGVRLALAQAARLGAIATASLALYASFRPARFVDAVAARGWPFTVSYLVVATLLALPRFRARAALILDSQRSRGLRLRGGPLRRLAALRPVAFPLLLGALAEVDERGFALDTRSAAGVRARTPLVPPVDTVADRCGRWGGVAAVAGCLVWRVLG